MFRVDQLLRATRSRRTCWAVRLCWISECRWIGPGFGRASVAAPPGCILERAGLRSQLNRHEEAIGDYDRAIRLDLDLAAAYLARCHAKSALGLHEQAVEDYDQLVRLDPDSAATVAEG